MTNAAAGRTSAAVSLRGRLGAAALVAPLLLFLLLTFIAPIAAMLWRAAADPEVGPVLPRTLSALEDWDRGAPPGEAAFAALVEDLREARASGALPGAATRLNYDVNGFRSLLFGTARRLPAELADPARETLIAIDPKWGERETWAAIDRARGPLTDFYLLGALDLRRDADGGVVQAPAEQAIFRAVLGRTLWISGMVTLACLALGYPLAYLLASLKQGAANLMLIAVLLPFWTSLLVRTTAWVVLLQREGVVNAALLGAGAIDEPLPMIFNRFAVYVAMTHILLPFMVLPLYSVMKGVPDNLTRAALSLGASPWAAFRRVYLPLTLPGVGAGCLIVFIQALGYYITPALVGGAEDQMISYFIAFYASRTINWGMAAALSLMLLAATLALYLVYSRLAGFDKLRLA